MRDIGERCCSIPSQYTCARSASPSFQLHATPVGSFGRGTEAARPSQVVRRELGPRPSASRGSQCRRKHARTPPRSRPCPPGAGGRAPGVWAGRSACRSRSRGGVSCRPSRSMGSSSVRTQVPLKRSNLAVNEFQGWWWSCSAACGLRSDGRSTSRSTRGRSLYARAECGCPATTRTSQMGLIDPRCCDNPDVTDG